MGRGTRTDTTASVPLELRRQPRSTHPAWLAEAQLGDQLADTVASVLAQVQSPDAPSDDHARQEWLQSLTGQLAAVAIPYVLASVRRRIRDAGLALVDPTSFDGPRIDPSTLLALRENLGHWATGLSANVDHALWEVIEETRSGAAAGLAHQVGEHGLEQATLQLLLTADELAQWRAEFQVESDDEVMEHEDWTAFYGAILEGQDAGSALRESLSAIAIVG